MAGGVGDSETAVCTHCNLSIQHYSGGLRVAFFCLGTARIFRYKTYYEIEAPVLVAGFSYMQKKGGQKAAHPRRLVRASATTRDKLQK